MPQSSKPLLIFDFDGTLAKSLETGLEIYNEIAGDYGLPTVTMDEVKELRKLNTRALLAHMGVSRVLAMKVGARIRKSLHERVDEIELIGGVDSSIRELHREGYRLGILTSNSIENVRRLMSRFGLLDCFSFVEGGVSIFGKSQRIAKVLRKQNVAPSEAIYVGDETRDMEAARDSGVASIAVCWGTNEQEALVTEGPTFCISSPEDLLKCAREFEDHFPSK